MRQTYAALIRFADIFRDEVKKLDGSQVTDLEERKDFILVYIVLQKKHSDESLQLTEKFQDYIHLTKEFGAFKWVCIITAYITLLLTLTLSALFP